MNDLSTPTPPPPAIQPQRVEPQQVEVLTPPPPARKAIEPPLHVLSSIVTIALDWVWFIVEVPATLSIAGLPALLPLSLTLATLNLAAVTLIQHFMSGEKWGVAAAKGVAMGIISGVPYPVFGTAIGAPLALWGGFNELKKYLPSKSQGGE